jgi:hypothetical protein
MTGKEKSIAVNSCRNFAISIEKQEQTMNDKQEVKRSTVDRNNLPKLFPTHRHSPQFWEQLGRTVATFGFLEEVLGRAIFAFTATREYSDKEIEEAYKAWLPKLERALTDQLWNLAESYGKAVRENQGSTIEDIDKLVKDIKETTQIRNVLCHGSWRVPDSAGKSLPLFMNKHKEIFETAIDTNCLCQVQTHVAGLACSVIDTVTRMGWQFPGGAGPGKAI